jgi:opacity protein-like surface antigen
MNFVSRLPAMRRSAAVGTAALVLGLLGPSGAWAQCTDNFNFFATINGQPTPVQNLLPLGTGSSLSSLTSTINTVNTAFLTSTSAFVSAPGGVKPDQQGGGVWARGIAGTIDTSTDSTATLSGTFVATGRQTCHTTTSQSYSGYQVGHDISVLNQGGSGANWHFGVTAGYLSAKTKDTTPGGTYFQPAFGGNLTTAPGTFSENSDIPFVGLYTAYTKGNLALDGQMRWDFYQNSLTDPANGLANQRLDARGFSVTGNAAYTFPLRNNWFIEPSIGGVWSRVQIDPLNVAGLVSGGSSFARGSVTVDDIDSFLGRASVSVGTSFVDRGITWQPFFTASVFHEFAGDVTVRSLESGTASGLDGLLLTTTSSGGIGTYGQFALGTAAVLGNSGWLGYSRVDYRIGDHVEGWSVNAGLRYQFTPGPTRGSIKDGFAPAVVGYNWTGPYAGAYVGSIWGSESWRFQDPPQTTVDPDFAGYLIGGQVGYNIQSGRTVFGVEADYGGSNAHGGVSCPNQNQFTCNADANSLGSLTGRLGVTWGRALFYGKGGLAFGQVSAGTQDNAGPASGIGRDDTKWATGWTVGGGMEFALTDRFSAKAEYMHYDLGSDTFTTFVFPGSTGLTDVDTKGDTVRIGVNYHLHAMREPAPLK